MYRQLNSYEFPGQVRQFWNNEITRKSVERALVELAMKTKDMITPMITFKQLLTGLTITLSLFSSLSHAEIYKWVDENGNVHFSDQKDAAKNSKVEQITVDTTANVMDRFDSDASNDLIKSIQKKPAPAKKKTIVASHKAKSGKAEDHRCTLARNIVEGRVRLTNGLPTGDHEIKVAMRDIRKFCD